MTPLRISLRIDLPNGARLGHGKIALLESLVRAGSIAAAARDHDMSYRRAWLLIDEMNRAFREPVVATFPGRSQGTGATLTPFGDRLVASYRKAEERARAASNGILDEVVAAVAPVLAPSAGIERAPARKRPRRA